jgi:hypothetical protein
LTNDPKTIFQVTWGDSTVQMDFQTVKQTLKSVSDNDNILVFAPSPTVGKLQAGSVLVMQGLAIKKVLGVVPVDSGIAVITEPGSVFDAVKEGHIHWEQDIDYTKYASLSLPPSRDIGTKWADLGSPDELHAILGLWRWATRADTGSESDTATADSVKSRAVCGHGDTIKVNAAKLGRWDWCVYPSTSGGQLRMMITLKNTVGGIAGQITGNMAMGGFRTFSDLEIHGHQMTNLTWSTKNLAALFTLQWQLGKEAPGVWAEEDVIPLPLGFEVPIVVGGLPLMLDVAAAAMIHPGLTGGKELSVGNYRIEYKGGSTFTISKDKVDDSGEISGKVEIPPTTEIPTVGAATMVIAIAAPRLELRLDAAAFWGRFKFLLPKWANTIPQIIALSPTGRGLMNSPQGQLIQRAFGVFKSQGGTADSALKSTAAVHIDLITAAATFQTGALVIVPCNRLQLIGTVQAGVNAVALGMSVAKWQKVLWRDSTAFFSNNSPTCQS